MHIESIKIDGIGGIDKLSLNFDRHMNIICGPNGIGKTTILNAITHICGNVASYKHNYKIKRNAVKAQGGVALVLETDNKKININYKTSSFKPSERVYETEHWQEVNNVISSILSIKSSRSFDYQELTSISRDLDRETYNSVEQAINGVSIEDAKNWFVNRFLFDGAKTLSLIQTENFKFAKNCFSIIDDAVSFENVDPSTFDILVKTSNGSIFYEYLSSGYKSLITILFSIIKEVEYRFADQKMTAKDFNGVILIDELEIHLHPEWQTKIIKILREAFPQAQFIVTTHSPHIIQSAEGNEIIALERIGDNVQRREIPQTQNGFKYWTLDEVLTDIMGMQDTNTKEFNELLNEFNQAIDNEDGEKAREIFTILDASLHPQNYLRKMLKLDMAGLR